MTDSYTLYMFVYKLFVKVVKIINNKKFKIFQDYFMNKFSCGRLPQWNILEINYLLSEILYEIPHLDVITKRVYITMDFGINLKP